MDERVSGWVSENKVKRSKREWLYIIIVKYCKMKKCCKWANEWDSDRQIKAQTYEQSGKNHLEKHLESRHLLRHQTDAIMSKAKCSNSH